MYTAVKKIERLCTAHNIRLSRQKEQGKTVYGLHGFLADIEAVEREINGYWVEHADTGHYLYREDLSWE